MLGLTGSYPLPLKSKCSQKKQLIQGQEKELTKRALLCFVQVAEIEKTERPRLRQR